MHKEKLSEHKMQQSIILTPENLQQSSSRQSGGNHTCPVPRSNSYLTSPSDTATTRASSRCGQLTNTDLPSTCVATSSHT